MFEIPGFQIKIFFKFFDFEKFVKIQSKIISKIIHKIIQIS